MVYKACLYSVAVQIYIVHPEYADSSQNCPFIFKDVVLMHLAGRAQFHVYLQHPETPVESD